MHDPEEFQEETIKAIRALQEDITQTQSRQFALEAVVKSFLQQVPLAPLLQIQENYDAEVVGQATGLAPTQQRPQYWEDWSDFLSQLAQKEKARATEPTKY